MAHGLSAPSRCPAGGTADPSRPERRGRRPLRALRTVPRLLPDVLRAGDGDGLAAGAHLPDQVPRRGPHRPHRLDGAASRPLSRLPRLRDGLSVRRALWPAHRGRARGDRAAAPGRLVRGGSSGGSTSRVLLPHPRVLSLAAAGLRFYQVSGLQRLVRASGLLRLLPGPLAAWEPLLPTLPRGGRPRPAARAHSPPTGPSAPPSGS